MTSETHSTGSSGLDDFRALVATDSSLQDELRATTAPGEFVALVIRRAAERGLTITADDVRDAIASARLAWFERWI